MSPLKIKHIVLVLSGKGGVGKSSVTVQLALGFRASNLRVGVLDIDLCGPSIPRMLGLESREVHQCDQGWVPVYADKDQSLAVMSLAFLLSSREDAVVWRGPKKTAMIRQLIFDVAWPELDVLLVDTPPGTSDEHIAIVENIKSLSCAMGAVLVTTPQNVAVADVRRQVTFCRRTMLPVHGIIENMSGFSCPHCQECTNVFSTGGGESLAELSDVAFLGRIPLEPGLANRLDVGVSCIGQEQTTAADTAVSDIVIKLKNLLVV